MTSPTLIASGFSLPDEVVSLADKPTSFAARKRQRDNNTQCSGISIDEGCASAPPKMSKVTTTPAPGAPDHIAAARPIVTVRRTSHAKRPQLQYDPAVPMTKEETSAWRTAQRRKRNRESAAACRKRQRDRIDELEAEVAGWRDKFAAALGALKGVDGAGASEVEAGLQAELAKCRGLPGGAASASAAALTAPGGKQEDEERCHTPPHAPQATTSMTDGDSIEGKSHVISPYDHRGLYIPSSVQSSYSHAQVVASENGNDLHFPILEEPLLLPSGPTLPRAENRKHFTEMHIRPATSRLSRYPSLNNIESTCDDLLQILPESCFSLTEKKTMPFPETCPSLVASAAVEANRTAAASLMATMAADDVRAKSDCVGSVHGEELPVITTDESGEDSDLDEFLLEAVQWL